jgi:spore germination cell wall hydrolase CwlJ-like protein|tara:strand:+ start:361 stop:750 length:390 start_codon:yes stop_codon:yes gene_type:complete
MTPDELLRRFVLALAVYREARGESAYGKQLVAQTIENRVTDARWPDTYRDVVLQPWQFSAFNPNDPNALVFPRPGSESWAECVAAATVVLEADAPLTTANHYHTTAVEPGWAAAGQIVAREGAHLFYAL